MINILTVIAVLVSIVAMIMTNDNYLSGIMPVVLPLIIVNTIAFYKIRDSIINITGMLSRAEDPRSLGMVLECLELPAPTQNHKSLESKVLVLLSKMHASQFNLLTSNQRRLLRIYVSPEFAAKCANDQFVRGMVSELSRLGDELDLQVMKRLAANIDPDMIRLDVVEHARNCVEITEARLTAERETNLLLRPASIGDLGLLRPAASPGQEDVDQLLRPAVKSEFDR
ncbi:MAG: hypothetical protein ABJA67_16480 [Chthonomonadales bacterium]